MSSGHKKVSRYYFEGSSGVISGGPGMSVRTPFRATEIIVEEVNETNEPLDAPHTPRKPMN